MNFLEEMILHYHLKRFVELFHLADVKFHTHIQAKIYPNIMDIFSIYQDIFYTYSSYICIIFYNAFMQVFSQLLTPVLLSGRY